MRSIVCLMLVLLPSVVRAEQQQSTYVVKQGAFPWYDRVNQWAISVLPDKYVGDRPVPQQGCGARSIVVPAGTTRATIAVLAGQLAEVLG